MASNIDLKNRQVLFVIKRDATNSGMIFSRSSSNTQFTTNAGSTARLRYAAAPSPSWTSNVLSDTAFTGSSELLGGFTGTANMGFSVNGNFNTVSGNAGGTQSIINMMGKRGDGNFDWFDGVFAEVVFLPNTDGDLRQKLEGYLAHKWGLAGNLPADHPSKGAAPMDTIATLDGSVTDPEGNPTPALWTKVSGPGDVTFADPTAVNTVASFSAAGTYTLRLTAHDGFGTNFSEVVIFVSENTDRTMTYDSKGASSGTAPVDGNNPYEPDEIVTVLGQGDLWKTGHAFAGWNTASDGSGTAHAPSDTFTIPADTTLYAQWEPSSYTATFDANGGAAANPTSKSVAYGQAYGPLPTTTLAGFNFTGWFTAPADGTLVTVDTLLSIDADHTLYAQWNALPQVDAGPNQTVALSELVPWSPSEITTAAWYDAADAGTITSPGGSAVSQWNDKSGNNNHLAQGTAGNRPATGADTIGGLDTVTFNAANANFMDAANSASLNFDVSDGMSSFIVFKSPGHTGTGGINCVFGKGSPWTGAGALGGYGLYYNADFNHTSKFAEGDNRTVNLGTGLLNTTLLVSTTANHATGAQALHYNGGVLSSTRTASPPRTSDNIGDFRVGNVAPQYAGGPTYNETTRHANLDLGELILIPGAISAEDRQRVEGYLAHKWGMAASLPETHPYKITAPGTLVALATLNGSATDAENDELTLAWTVVSGNAAAVTVANSADPGTTTTFTEEGTYALRLAAGDGFGASFDEVVITVGDAVAPTPFEVWATSGEGRGDITFSGDTNNDGLPDGLAWLLGADSPAANAKDLLPVLDPQNGALAVSFHYLVPAARGSAILRLQHSTTLAADSWTAVEIPDASAPVDGVEFVVTPVPGSDFNHIQATVPAGGSDRIFVRLFGEGSDS